MNRLLTADGNYPVQGISEGREFSIACSGTFASGVVKAQYATAAPAKATKTIDDNEDADAIVLSATDGGTFGNGITIAVVVPTNPNSTLSVVKTGLDIVVNTATDEGDAATVAIGTGTNGVVTITQATAGTQGNAWDVIVIAPLTINSSLAVSLSFAHARPRLVITLGTDGAGDPDNTKNTATLIAAAVDALAGFTATASGTGASAVAAQAAEAFAGGGDNSANTSTVGDVLAALQSPDFTSLFTAALAVDADVEELIKPIAETALTGGTNGTFVDFSGDNAITFSAAGQLIGTNCGMMPTININVASATGSTSIRTIVNELPE